MWLTASHQWSTTGTNGTSYLVTPQIFCTGLYLYLLRVRCSQVWFQLQKNVPVVYLWKTLIIPLSSSPSHPHPTHYLTSSHHHPHPTHYLTSFCHPHPHPCPHPVLIPSLLLLLGIVIVIPSTPWAVAHGAGGGWCVWLVIGWWLWGPKAIPVISLLSS